MDFLDQSVLPQSPHHMVLLKYLLVLANILFLPYVSVLFGSLSLSLFFKKKGGRTDQKISKEFSKELIDQITFNKGVAFSLGVVPLLSSVFGYAQLLHLSKLNVPEYLLLSLLLLIAALFLIYIYKYTFHLKDIFGNISRQNVDEPAKEKEESSGTDCKLIEETASYHKKISRLNQRSGLYGLILLAASTYLYVGSVHLASDTARWESGNNLFGVIFSLQALVSYLQFVTASFVMTSVFILYRYFRPGSEFSLYDEEYKLYVKNFALRTGLTATILLPALMVLTVITRPVASLSFDFFIAALVVLILFLFIGSLFYVMIKESSIPAGSQISVKFSSSLVFLFVFAMVLMVIKDQFAFDTSTKKQYAILSANYEEYEKKIQEEQGINLTPISGADIYNGRCIACHSFDKKIVGPPYNAVLPNYEGKKDELVKFILNPVKKNPEYPAMPSQGLKPKEAEAVAEYLITTYKK